MFDTEAFAASGNVSIPPGGTRYWAG